MPVSPQLRQIGKILASLSMYGRAVDPAHSEELQVVPTTFDLESTAEPLWEDEQTSWIRSTGDQGVKFRAFIDGVQRSSVVYWVTLDKMGAIVPIVLSHIASGVTIRKEDRKLTIDSNHVKDRVLLLLPLTGMEKQGFEGGETIRKWIREGFVVHETKIAEDPLQGLAFDQRISPLILCDTTFTKLDRDEASEQEKIEEFESDPQSHPELAKSLLVGNNLYNIGKIRGRAQGRVNTIRQILEMLVLARFRESYKNEEYVLVDGPLFFLGKWLRKYGTMRSMSDEERERVVLKNSIGMVKTLKGRPKSIETLKTILNLDRDQYSNIMSIHEAVDVQTEDGAIPQYMKPHITTFMRFRLPPDLKLPNMLGITRIDMHLSTIGADTLDEAKSDKGVTKQNVDKIMAGLKREKWPGLTQLGRIYNETYPISETERMLRSRMYSTLEMNYIYSMIRA